MLCSGLCSCDTYDDLSTEENLEADGEAGEVAISQIAEISRRGEGSQSWLRDIDCIVGSGCPAPVCLRHLGLHWS